MSLVELSCFPSDVREGEEKPAIYNHEGAVTSAQPPWYLSLGFQLPESWEAILLLLLWLNPVCLQKAHMLKAWSPCCHRWKLEELKMCCLTTVRFQITGDVGPKGIRKL